MMTTLRKRLCQSLAATLLCLGSGIQAAQFVEFDNYEIHYNAFNSSFVKPEIAQQNNLVRGKRRALVNVSVLQKQSDGTLKAVNALVSGSATNLIGQEQQMKFNKIDEGKAIYYIGSFGFTDAQVMRIGLDVQPDPNKPAYTINFEQKFYTD
ncbi:MAG: DUF4426 domain-containing protein [Marinobacterium sp.]|nr:DUF4426 domain-containing protein [Marinobacterium sp.]